MPEKSIHTRIKKILKDTNLNYSSFGQKLGISDVVVGNVIKGRNKPSYDLLLKIIQTFDWINAEWLLTGNGEMLKNGGNINQNTGTGANIIQNGNGNISGTINIGGESHTKKSLEERLKGMVHEIRNLRTQVDNLTKIIEEKERLIETKNEIIELLRSK